MGDMTDSVPLLKIAIQAPFICFCMCIDHSKYVSLHVEVCSGN